RVLAMALALAGLAALTGCQGCPSFSGQCFNLETGRSTQLTHLRPFYDIAEPRSMAGRRLLWSEFRGESIEDACGNERKATDRTMLLFWKDIEFD
ncbi:MAG: hypothetical protein JXR96_28410, partial [Deltaproteobacteria bacterium]|nr:hypothetical protein [Deltaproteobacteria bacterium]